MGKKPKELDLKVYVIKWAEKEVVIPEWKIKIVKVVMDGAEDVGISHLNIKRRKRRLYQDKGAHMPKNMDGKKITCFVIVYFERLD